MDRHYLERLGIPIVCPSHSAEAHPSAATSSYRNQNQGCHGTRSRTGTDHANNNSNNNSNSNSNSNSTNATTHIIDDGTLISHASGNVAPALVAAEDHDQAAHSEEREEAEEEGEDSEDGESDDDDEDDNVLLTMELEDMGLITIPESDSSEFFAATVSVETFAPTFKLDLSAKGLQGEELFQLQTTALDGITTHRILSQLAILKSMRREDCFDSEGHQEVAPAETLMSLLRTALSAGATVHFPMGFQTPQECVCCYFNLVCQSWKPTQHEFSRWLSCEEVLPNVFSMTSSSRLVLGSTFLRLQEYYENASNEFWHKRFTIEEYVAHSRDKGRSMSMGIFQYYLQWPGFNVPGWVLEDARQGLLGPLRPQEDALLKSIASNIESREAKSGHSYYVIGSTPRDDSTIRHEMAHGLYSTNAAYKAAAAEILSEELSDEEISKLRTTLLSLGYRNDDTILFDEMQAYLCSGSDLGLNRLDVMDLLSANFDSFAMPSLT